MRKNYHDVLGKKKKTEQNKTEQNKTKQNKTEQKYTTPPDTAGGCVADRPPISSPSPDLCLPPGQVCNVLKLQAFFFGPNPIN